MAGVWTAVATAAVGAYSAYSQSKAQKKAAEAAAKGTTTTRTPYMAERINPVIPYIMSDAQKIYENRMRTYGMEPGDFSPIAAQLAGISPSYSGVGAPGSQEYNGYGNSTPQQIQQMQSAQSPTQGMGDDELAAYMEQMAARRAGRVSQMQGGGMSQEQGGGQIGMMSQEGPQMGDLINYWDSGR